MGMFGGISQEDAAKWGQFTTQKINAAELARKQLRPQQVIYCSPMVDPYQPAERERPQMPGLLQVLMAHPPKIFVIQTRGPLILRDLPLLKELATTTRLRISFSVTTDRDEMRRHYEPRCEPNIERLGVIEELRRHGLEVYATLAPLLPCNPERLVELALTASQNDLIGDPLHLRETKARGATTREAAVRIAHRQGDELWFQAEYQREVVERMAAAAAGRGFRFEVGPRGFSLLAKA